jgi:hypothetical protein
MAIMTPVRIMRISAGPTGALVCGPLKAGLFMAGGIGASRFLCGSASSGALGVVREGIRSAASRLREDDAPRKNGSGAASKPRRWH